jgi:hypothetical protein
LRTLDKFTQGGDLSGDIAAGDQRQAEGHAIDATADPQIEVIQCTSARTDENFVWAGLRVGDLLVLQNFRPTVPRNDNRSHHVS